MAPFVDTSNFTGAVIVTVLVRNEPLALKGSGADGLPAVVTKPGKFVVDTVSVGTTTVPLTDTLVVVAPRLESEIALEKNPALLPVSRT